MEMGKQTAWEEIDKKSSEIFTASDEIWGCAETAFTEDKSMKILCDVLKAEGFTVETGLADVKTAFKGTFGSGKPVIGILGEFGIRKRELPRRSLCMMAPADTAADITCSAQRPSPRRSESKNIWKKAENREP